MKHYNFNVMNRRSFLSTTSKAGILAALASITNVPGVLKQALAAGSFAPGKKVLFVWLRFGNDALNSVIPILDSAYVDTSGTPATNTNWGKSANRPTLVIPPDPLTNYTTAGLADFPASGNSSTYGFYPNAIRLGNGFAALHPSLKFLAPVYNAGDLALIHRVAYPRQSRSHFDSQIYWENGTPNNGVNKEGIFYRTLLESGLDNLGSRGVTIQNSLPLIMRGSDAAMTNLTNPLRYNLLGIPSGNPTGVGDVKADSSIASGNTYGFAAKDNRDMLFHQYDNLQATLNAFAAIDFDEDPVSGNPNKPGNYYQDDPDTDGDAAWVPINQSGTSIGDPGKGYFLFPTRSDKNGGWVRPDRSVTANKYVVNTNHHGFFYNLKAAALVLNHTDAVIAGTEIGGFDTHQTQGQLTGAHPDLQRAIGWALYGLRKYFKIYGRNGTSPAANAKTAWDDLVIVTLSEFGRTTIENGDRGTDHAEAGLMFVAGGGVKGYGRHTSGHGVLNCSPTESGIAAGLQWAPGQTGSMFGANSRYLSRNTDFRSVLGEVIRKHLGATQTQLDRIIPGYATAGENLQNGGTSSIDGKVIRGEVGIL